MRHKTSSQFLKKIYVAAGALVLKVKHSIERHNNKDSSVNMIAASLLEEQPQEYLAKMLQQPE